MLNPDGVPLMTGPDRFYPPVILDWLSTGAWDWCMPVSSSPRRADLPSNMSTLDPTTLDEVVECSEAFSWEHYQAFVVSKVKAEAA